MTKSRDRPIAGASRRSSRADSEWNVEIHIREQSACKSADTRVRISSAALFVNVTASTPSAGASPVATMCAMRWAMTRVLPDPAPARISTAPSACSTASRCSGLSPEVKSIRATAGAI